ncbi:ABC transporter permease [Nocardioides sp. LHG3406-4]|uniref:ABC transporter permease n=1 Tax=Nocardioides sp. LHG3406-4 TaxID=2804575 RepID=UPI003CF531BA
MPLIPPLVLVIAWWISGTMFGGLRGRILTPPDQIAEAFRDLLSDETLWSNLAVTMKEFFIAFVAAYGIGLVAGLIVGMSRFATAVFEPFVFGIYAIPKITILPILLVILGLNSTMVVVFAALHGVLPVFLATVNALKNVRPLYVEVGRCLGGSRLQIYRKVVLRSITLPVISAARICFTLCFLVVITAEIILGGAGMGHLVMAYYHAFDYPRMYASILFTVVVCGVAYLLAATAERRLASAEQQR